MKKLKKSIISNTQKLVRPMSFKKKRADASVDRSVLKSVRSEQAPDVGGLDSQSTKKWHMIEKDDDDRINDYTMKSGNSKMLNIDEQIPEMDNFERLANQYHKRNYDDRQTLKFGEAELLETQ